MFQFIAASLAVFHFRRSFFSCTILSISFVSKPQTRCQLAPKMNGIFHIWLVKKENCELKYLPSYYVASLWLNCKTILTLCTHVTDVLKKKVSLQWVTNLEYPSLSPPIVTSARIDIVEHKNRLLSQLLIFSKFFSVIVSVVVNISFVLRISSLENVQIFRRIVSGFFFCQQNTMRKITWDSANKRSSVIIEKEGKSSNRKSVIVQK